MYKVKNKKQKEEKKFEWKRYKVYSYENLPEESKKKAIEKHYDINLNHEWWQDDFLIDIGVPKEIQKKSYKVKEGNTIFSWDKVYFDIDRSNYVQFENLKVNDEESFRKTLGVSKSTWKKVEYSFDNKRENDTQINWYENEDLNQKDKDELAKADEKFEELMEKSKKQLKDQYEYESSKEAIEETFKVNEYKFDENGDIV